jgi:hypothetical protein
MVLLLELELALALALALTLDWVYCSENGRRSTHAIVGKINSPPDAILA